MSGSYFTGRVWRNSAFSLLDRLVAMAGHAALLYLMARQLGPKSFGVATMGFALASVVAVASSFGSLTYGLRSMAGGRAKGSEFLAGLFAFQSINAVAGGLLLAAAAVLFARDAREGAFIAALAASLPGESLAGVVRSSFFSRQQFLPVVLLRIALSAAVFLAGAAALWSGVGLLGIGLILAAFSWLEGLGGIAIHRRWIGPCALRIDAAGYREMARQSFPYFLVTVLAVVHQKVDIPMLRALRGRTEVGWYGVAAATTNAALVALTSMTAALFPAVASAGGAAESLCPARAIRTLLTPLALGAAAAMTLTVAAGPAVRLFLGPSYEPSIRPMAILAWFLPFVFVSSTAIRMLLAGGLTGTAIRILAVNCVVNIGLNSALIPLAGISGAAVSTVISGAVSAAQCVAALRSLPPAAADLVPAPDRA